MLDFTQRFECFKKGHKKFTRVMTPTLKKAVRLLHDFIHEAAILRKDFCFTPPSEECCRSLFLFMNYCRISAGPVWWLSGAKSLLGLSLSLQAASITIAGMAHRRTEPEWLHDYTSPLLLLFPPCGCWWYSELCITCSPHSLACIVNPEERCYLRFYDVHKSTLLPRAS